MKPIIDKTLCCGCGACAQRCPKRCIKMRVDEQGFLYPLVDKDKCINCGLCEKVCSVLNHGEPIQPLSCFAAINNDEKIRLASSSGGVFTAFAEHVIAQGGVVFGAKFNEKWDVIHDYTETIGGLTAFRGSKYVESVIGDNYIRAERFLNQNRKVLFTGTPCQIAGLKHFLHKEYDNLLCVEVACHGVPSPRVWKSYLQGKNVAEVNFRDKSTGWKAYSVKIGKIRKYHDRNDYMNCFLANFSLRPSCFNCQAKCGKSMADITLADFWGISKIAPEIDDDKGTSAVVIWTINGLNTFKPRTTQLQSISYEKVVNYNPSIIISSQRPDKYEYFWLDFSHNPLSAIEKYSKRNLPSLPLRIKQLLIKIIKS